MPKISRSDTFYRKLPDHIKTASIPDAKLSVSITAIMPKGMEKVSQKIIVEAMGEVEKIFKKRVKKALENMEDNDG